MVKRTPDTKLPPGAERIFDMGLDLLVLNKELVTALEASTNNLQMLLECVVEGDNLETLIHGNIQANKLTLAKAKGA